MTSGERTSSPAAKLPRSRSARVRRRRSTFSCDIAYSRSPAALRAGLRSASIIVASRSSTAPAVSRERQPGFRRVPLDRAPSTRTDRAACGPDFEIGARTGQARFAEPAPKSPAPVALPDHQLRSQRDTCRRRASRVNRRNTAIGLGGYGRSRTAPGHRNGSNTCSLLSVCVRALT
jgi:hypothetical protein